MSSPNLNNVIVIGCILAYTSVFLLGADGVEQSSTNFRYLCTVSLLILVNPSLIQFKSLFVLFFPSIYVSLTPSVSFTMSILLSTT